MDEMQGFIWSISKQTFSFEGGGGRRIVIRKLKILLEIYYEKYIIDIILVINYVPISN
jgi:hypothetical protein